MHVHAGSALAFSRKDLVLRGPLLARLSRVVWDQGSACNFVSSILVHHICDNHVFVVSQDIAQTHLELSPYVPNDTIHTP